jgi:hypothetical protein
MMWTVDISRIYCSIKDMMLDEAIGGSQSTCRHMSAYRFGYGPDGKKDNPKDEEDSAAMDV